MTSMPQSVTSPTAASGLDETVQHATSAMSRERVREDAEEQRWQLEWDRRNVED